MGLRRGSSWGKRLNEVAAFAEDCQRGWPSAYAVELAEVADALAEQAVRLNAAAH